MFVSFTPFLGFHLLLAGLMALALKGNVIAAAVGTFIGNPLTFPLIWIATYNLGGTLLGRVPSETVVVTWPPRISDSLLPETTENWFGFWDLIEPVLLPMTVGGIILGLAFGLLSYYLVREGVGAYQAQRRERILARRAHASHRFELDDEIP
ncbi:uncharacterized protein (DUF2062 family) [Rhodoligotrophos appendicifer]